MQTHNESHTEEAHDHLRRAYLLMSWGKLEEADEACLSAEAALGDDPHPMPSTLRGAILIAGGHIDEALRVLKPVTRRWESFVLGHLYFAEACLLGDRRPQGERSLEAARSHDDGSHAEYLDSLTALYDAPMSTGEPLVVNADETRTTGE